MKLIFDIIKNGSDFPEKRKYIFNKSGGIIGRSEECDWQLNDSQNFISSNHVSIEYRNNLYFIKDLSTNGTFLKQSHKKLPKNIAMKINNTDIFIIGSYEIQARFMDNEYDQDDIVSYKPQTEYSNINKSIDISRQLIPEDDDFLLTNSKVMNNSFIHQEEEVNYSDTNVLNLFKDEIDEEIIDLYDFEKEPLFLSSGDSLDSVSNQIKNEHIEMPRFEENFVEDLEEFEVKDEIQNNIIEVEDVFEEKEMEELKGIDNSLESFGKKLGINLLSLSLEQREKKLDEIADIVLNSLDGLKNSLEIKDKIKKDLSIEELSPLKNENPIKMGQHSLSLLTDNLSKDKIKISEAINKSFNELNIHNIALHRASKNLINISISKFSPKNLEYYFEENGQLNSLMPKKYQMWDCYINMFKKLNEDPDFGINLLAKDFSNEYNNISYSIKLQSI